MRIVHHISIAVTPDVRTELRAFGIPSSGDLTTFDIDEADGRWPALREWVQRRGAVDVVWTEFTREEIINARWLELWPEWHHGYPQPRDNDFGFLAVTYDTSNYCSTCGIGLVQIAPFQMKTEPKWGRHGIMQLNWIFDEYFVTPSVWKSVFAPLGIGHREVHDRAGSVLTTVVQLVVSERVGVFVDGLLGTTCSRCGRIKFAPAVRGAFPPLQREPSGAIARTAEYFGSGGSANNCILVSHEVGRRLTADRVRGASLRPVTGTETSTLPVARIRQ